MNKLKSIWTSLTGSISSIIPLFFTVCKSGACTVACVSPIASILGISSASLMASPKTQSLFPVLIAISAVSFTVSYYKLYVLPKYTNNNTCTTDCACENPTQSKQYKLSLYTFWIGLISSILFFTYFEFQNYKANIISSTNNTTEISSEEESLEVDKPCCVNGTSCDSTTIKKVRIKITKKPCCSANQKCE